MRTIEFTARFRRDFKRLKAGRFGLSLQIDLEAVVSVLAQDTPLDRKYVDHPLSGTWADHRDCHLHPDLILIYRKAEPNRLILVRLGSHSDLGL